MTPKFLRKKLRLLQRRFLKQSGVIAACAALGVFALVSYTIHMNNQRPTIDSAAYAPLLDVIAKAESNGNYNAYFGNAGNSQIKFTDMTVAEVMKWQADFIAQGQPSSAVGRYQIISTTLSGLVNRKIVDVNEKFDEATQDRLAIALVERRGSLDYVAQQLSAHEFAANLAKEWAGLPRVLGGNPTDSYYAGDGLNKSRTSVEEVLGAIAPIRAE